ncbi:hypothetical protein GT347_20340 [Xylophilus rhododendri]|uniref:Uncharacterized protein n=1 Tax=Xylophilus rhododendri TaxID=2697032 RepID=A0A857JAF7_9BURK|nr:hypothetical protein [Xylophilus rhododendri]QHJ00122.1 hypothetical protein GT347_20340 [Xylophilus rhododendri]
MSIITFPSEFGLQVMGQQFGEQRFDLSFGSGDTGAQQHRVLAPPRWTCGLTAEQLLEAPAAAAWRRLVLSLQGRVNQLAVSDLLNHVPRGTARGNWVAQSGALPGAMGMWVAMGGDQVYRTLLEGDWIGVGQDAAGPARQLLHVQADTAADGAGNAYVQFVQPLRIAVQAGAAVVWDRPTCLMRQTGTARGWSSSQGFQGGFSLDLMESWE